MHILLVPIFSFLQPEWRLNAYGNRLIGNIDKILIIDCLSLNL